MPNSATQRTDSSHVNDGGRALDKMLGLLPSTALDKIGALWEVGRAVHEDSQGDGTTGASDFARRFPLFHNSPIGRKKRMPLRQVVSTIQACIGRIDGTVAAAQSWVRERSCGRLQRIKPATDRRNDNWMGVKHM